MVTKRRPVVGVMGSGTQEHAAWAAPVGRLLARLGVHLLTGGGGGVMTSASRAFVGVSPREGVCIGVLPATAADDVTPKAGYPNPWIEVPVRTHLWLSGDDGEALESRNTINVLSSDAIVALPGGPGTRSEVALALRHGRPVASYGAALDAKTLVRHCETLADVEAFLREAIRGLSDR